MQVPIPLYYNAYTQKIHKLGGKCRTVIKNIIKIISIKIGIRVTYKQVIR